MKKAKAIVLICALCLIMVGAVITVMVPAIPDRALAYCEDAGHGDMVPEEEFRASMLRCVMREGTVLTPSPTAFVTPDDPYVQAIALDIMRTAGNDYDRADAALEFVWSEIDYSSDRDTYGTDNYWAYPLETLYLQRGDCEDMAVLLCSILIAMGLDAVLFDYEDHVAAGVALEDSEGLYCVGGYAYCDATIFYSHVGDEPRVHREDPAIRHPGTDAVSDTVNGAIMMYRRAIWEIFRI